MKHFFLCASTILCLLSCQKQDQECSESDGKQENSASTMDRQRAAELNMTVDEYAMASDDEKMTQEAFIELCRYVSVNHKRREYSIDITENEAVNLGIRSKDYRKAVSDIENVNQVLKQNPAIKLIDLKQQYGDFKKKLHVE